MPRKRAPEPGRLRALGVVTKYLSERMRNLSKEEIDRINKHITDQLVGDEVGMFTPKEPNPANGLVMYAVMDAITQLGRLEYHLHMTKKNPFHEKIPDSDYLEMISSSFYDTCYVVHERLRKLNDLLKRKSLDSSKLQRVAEKVLQTPSRRSRDRQTIFDQVLGPRAPHVHVVNVDRPKVPRLHLLRTFSKIGEGKDRKVFEKAAREQFRRASRANLAEFKMVLKQVQLGANMFFDAAIPDLERVLTVN